MTNSIRFNFLGQVAVTTGISFGCAGLTSTLITVQNDYTPTAGKTLGIYAAILFSHASINTFGVRVLRYLNNTSVILHSLGVTSFAVAILAKAPKHQTAKFVFASFYDGTGDPGWSVRASPAYVAVCGILLSQYTVGQGSPHRILAYNNNRSPALTAPRTYPKRRKMLLGTPPSAC